MKQQHLLTFLLCFLSFGLFAQVQRPSSDISWKKRVKMADDFVKNKDFGSAAVFYQSVFDERAKELEIAYKAGDNFMKVRDFKNAVKMFRAVKDETKKFPKVELQYGLALKQSGDYDAAINVFQKFMETYRGGDLKEMATLIENEVKGCEYALKLKSENADPDVKLTHLDRMVNSDKNEYAPIPFMEGLIYFSSFREGKSQIFRSEITAGIWSKPSQPPIFKSMEKPHFGHGSFTPDQGSFYFTECDERADGTLKCDIFVMSLVNNTWEKPTRLPDFINDPASTATSPFSTIIDNKLVLFFVSNRAGGFGGSDIWYVEKPVRSSGYDFSQPINLGSEVNTPFDEMTPFYDKISEVLYFSSNGHPSLGGFDIFRSNGRFSSWDKPVNMGSPTNSFADDYYYVLNKEREKGYLISNRLDGTTKEYTDNDDIFSFEKQEIEVVIRGTIAEAGKATQRLSSVTVELIELNATGTENSLITRIFNDGEYFFRLSPSKRYRIEANKDGYEKSRFEIETDDFKVASDFVQDLQLVKLETAVVNRPPSLPKPKPTVEPATISETQPDPEPVITTPTPPTQSPTVSPVRPEPYEETVIEEPVAISEPEIPASNGFRQKQFDDLTDAEKMNIIYLNGKPYFRANGELVEVLGIVVNEGLTETEPPRKFTSDPIVEGNKENASGFGSSEIIETGTSYKIQLVAVSVFKAEKYKNVENLGAIQTEVTTDKDGNTVSRVMLTPFQNLDEAKATLSRINDLGFERAYIVQYVDGVRVKNSKIRLDTFRD